MEWYAWLPGTVSAAVALLALWLAVLADRRSKRADERAERAEQLERVRLEIVRAPPANDDPTIFALRNVGTEPAEDLEIDPASVLGQAFLGFPSRSQLNPGSKWIFGMGDPNAGTAPKLPSALRVTWQRPFAGEAHVVFPEDDSTAWSYSLPRLLD